MQNYCEISTPKGVMRGFFHTPQNKEFPVCIIFHGLRVFADLCGGADADLGGLTHEGDGQATRIHCFSRWDCQT